MKHIHEYRWSLYKHGDVKRPSTILKAASVWGVSMNEGFDGPAYSSSFFLNDSVKQWAESNTKNGTTSFAGYRAPHWSPFFVIDVDTRRESEDHKWDAAEKQWKKRTDLEREAFRAGNHEPPDRDVARKEALEVIRVLSEYGVDPKKLLTCFSGNKGFHIYVPTAYFDPDPDEKFSYRIRQMIEKAIWPKLDRAVMPYAEGSVDWQIYNTIHVIRAINSEHEKSRLFKVPVSWQEMNDLTFGQIRDLAVTPRVPWEKPGWQDIEAAPAMRKLWEDSAAWLEEKSKGGFVTEGRIHHRLDMIVSGDAAPPRRRLCMMKVIGQDCGSGNRNQAMLMLASEFRDMGMTPEQTFTLMRPWLQAQKGTDTTEDGLLTQVRYVYGPNFSWGCSHPLAMANCFTQCHLYPQAKLERGFAEEWHSIGHYMQKLYERMFIPRYYSFPYGQLASDIRIWGKQVFLMVGETTAGKTALALDFMRENSKKLSQMKEADPELLAMIGFYSLEMPGEEIAERGAQHHMQQDQNFVAKTMELQRVAMAAGGSDMDFNTMLSGTEADFSNVLFYDGMAPDIEGLFEMCEAAKKAHGINLFVIDFLDRMKSKGFNQYERLAPIATGLKEVAKELDVTIVMLAQMPREASKDGKGGLRTARGSGQLEENVDGLLTLVRATKPMLKDIGIELTDDELGKSEYRYVVLRAEKNRSGPEKRAVAMKFTGRTMMFEAIGAEAKKTANEELAEVIPF